MQCQPIFQKPRVYVEGGVRRGGGGVAVSDPRGGAGTKKKRIDIR